MLELLLNIDRQLFLFLNGHNSPFWDSVMWFLSGKKEWIPLYACIVGWLVYKYRKGAIIVILSIIILVVVTDKVAVVLFKDVFQRLRPCHETEIAHLVHLVNNYCGGQFGFISNHAANTFSVAMFTSLVFRKTLYVIPIFLWACAVSYSRIYLGVHYPIDILGGALFGILMALISYHLMVRYFGKPVKKF